MPKYPHPFQGEAHVFPSTNQIADVSHLLGGYRQDLEREFSDRKKKDKFDNLYIKIFLPHYKFCVSLSSYMEQFFRHHRNYKRK
jgi:hypothetical protein